MAGESVSRADASVKKAMLVTTVGKVSQVPSPIQWGGYKDTGSRNLRLRGLEEEWKDLFLGEREWGGSGGRVSQKDPVHQGSGTISICQ